MSRILRRLSLVGGGSSTEEEPRSPHRHHPLHRAQKNYDVSPTGGNRPISISADPRISFLSQSDPAPPQERHRSSRHKSRSDTSGAPRRHRSRADSADAPVRKHSSRSKKRRSEIPPELPAELPSPVEVVAPPSAPIPISASAVNMNRMSGSPPSGSSMGIVISGHRSRRDTGGSMPSTPLITATPPTPSPLEQARRSNTHPSTPNFSGNAPPPYPLEYPSILGHGEEYIAYAASKIAINTPEQDSLLHRYRTNFDPRIGRAELSSEPEPVEIGSSDSIYQPPRPHRTDSGKSFSGQETIPTSRRTDSGKSFSSQEAIPTSYRTDSGKSFSGFETIPTSYRTDSGKSFSGYETIPTSYRTDSGKSFSGYETIPTIPTKQPSVFRRKRGSLRENQYEFLRTFDTVFVIDDSASMDAFTRWTDTRTALETIATIATKYDSDGIDIHFLNSTHHDARNIRSAAEVRRLFDLVRPAGITPIAACLDRILRDYLDSYAIARTALSSPPASPMGPGLRAAQYPKPLNIIVLTDGEPTDDPESVIVDAARRLDALNAPLSQVGIQFFQIGDEEGAREALEDLDDALAEIYGIRDMVDYTPYINDRQREKRGVDEGEDGEALTGEWILKVLTGAVNRRLDRWENDHGKGRGE